MSGRVRTVLSDGRRVTGYRKTLRRNERTRPEDRPELRLTFILPEVFAFATSPGEYAGATVEHDGLVTVRGKDRDYVLRKAGEFLRSIAAGLTLAEPISATLFCPRYPGPNPEAPWREGYRDGYEITVATGSPAVTIARTGAKPLVVV